MSRLQTTVVAVALLAVALALRLPDLGAFLTPDETVWSGGAAQYITALGTHDWAATNVSGHPGVTTTWAGALGLTLKWLLARPDGVASLSELARALAADPIHLDFLPWLRLPVALATALGVVLVYLLSRRLMREATALLAAAFLLFDPFFLAHSRVLQMDALLATAISVSWLALLVATRTGKRRYHALSGVAIGLGVLTKSPALVMGPLILGWIVLQRWRERRSLSAALPDIVVDLMAVGLPALAIFFALWPALWTAPLATLDRMWTLMTVYSGVGHELGNYWLGQAVASPGALFYGAVLLWRTTPVTLLGLILALGSLAIAVVSRRRSEDRTRLELGPVQTERGTMTALLLAVLWFGVILSFGDKKFDRYLLPVFPLLDILAAWGWISLGGWLAIWLGRRGQESTERRLLAGGGALLILLQMAFTLGPRADYLTIYNPLLGGAGGARQVMLVGWGEGLEEAAAYLNEQPQAVDKRVAAWYGGNVFAAFFAGESKDVYYDLNSAADLYAADIDYVVTYINQMQRGLLDTSIAEQLAEPLFTAAEADVPLAQVYAWPKPYQHTTERLLAPGLQLLGWSVGEYEPVHGQIPVTLYWDAKTLQTSAQASPVSVWIKDAAGEVWDSLETQVGASTKAREKGWLGRPVIAQTVVLDPPPGLLSGPYRLEMAPAGGEGVILATIDIPPTRIDLAQADVLSDGVVFGDAVVLAGYDRLEAPGELALELVWEAVAAPPQDVTAFVHVVDANDAIVAQFDGKVTQLPGQAAQSWATGEVIRQRVRIPLDAEIPAKSRVFVGLYRPETGERLALSVGDLVIEDGRFLLLDRIE